MNIGRATGLNLPQPVMAHGSFWFWDVFAKKICGIRLETLQSNYPDFPNFSFPVAGANSAPDDLHYGNSLVFDGIFVWFVFEGSLWRIRVTPDREGQAAGSQPENVFQDNILFDLCRAAPLLVRPDPSKPRRYLVACLKTHFLVADVSRKDSFNLRFLRWQLDGGDDEMHSGVACGTRVFGLSRQGKFFVFNLADGLEGLPADDQQLSPVTILPGHYCAAPAVAGDYLVFETLKKEQLRPDADVHLRGIASLDSRFFGLHGPIPLSGAGQRPEKRDDFFDRAHLPGLTDAVSCYFCGDEKKTVLYYQPASQTLAHWNRRENAPEALIAMNNTNAVLWGGCMVLAGPELFMGRRLADQSEVFTKAIQGGSITHDHTRLLARPIVYGNLMALVFPGRVVFEHLP
jgi:hypothetical protein